MINQQDPIYTNSQFSYSCHVIIWTYFNYHFNLHTSLSALLIWSCREHVRGRGFASLYDNLMSYVSYIWTNMHSHDVTDIHDRLIVWTSLKEKLWTLSVKSNISLWNMSFQYCNAKRKLLLMNMEIYTTGHGKKNHTLGKE